MHNDLAGSFDLNEEQNIDLLDYTMILYDRKLRVVAQNTLFMISRNLRDQNLESIYLNVFFLLFFTAGMNAIYVLFLKNYLKKRILKSKMVFQLIPSRILFKSLPIKNFLKKIFEEEVKKV